MANAKNPSMADIHVLYSVHLLSEDVHSLHGLVLSALSNGRADWVVPTALVPTRSKVCCFYLVPRSCGGRGGSSEQYTCVCIPLLTELCFKAIVQMLSQDLLPHRLLGWHICRAGPLHRAGARYYFAKLGPWRHVQILQLLNVSPRHRC